jgi:Na+(H+)/acetate symporter ActP
VGLDHCHTQQRLKTGLLEFVAAPETRLDEFHEPFTPFYLLMLCLAALAGVIVQPHVVVLCGTGRRELDARAGLTGGHLLKRFMSILWAVFGIACVVWYLGPNSPLAAEGAPAQDFQLLEHLKVAATAQPAELLPDQIYAVNRVNQQFADRLFGRAVRELCSGLIPGLTGLFVAMVVASAVSHAATHMIVGSGLFAEHIYRNGIAPEQTTEHYRTVGRFCGPLLVAAVADSANELQQHRRCAQTVHQNSGNHRSQHVDGTGLDAMEWQFRLGGDSRRCDCRDLLWLLSAGSAANIPWTC